MNLFRWKCYIISKKCKHISKRITRAKQVLHGYQEVSNCINPNLIEPCLVNDGERNFAICSWVLALQMGWFDKVDTLEMVKTLVKGISGHEFSRSCKDSQVTSVVNSIYRYKGELQGLNKIRYLIL